MSLETNVTSAFTRVATEFKTLRTTLTGNSSGSLAALTTTQKGSLIAAINELDAAIEALSSAEGGATIVDGLPSTTSVWSSSKTNTEIGAAVTAVINAAPGALDTLDELAAALGDDPNFATTITNLIAGKAAAVHSHVSTDISDFNTAVDGRVAAAVPVASETVQGKVELATVAEATAGTDTARAVTPAGVKAVGDTKAPISHTHTASQVTDFSTAADARVNALVPAATETAAGKVELATAAETTTGTDNTRAVHPAGLKVELDKKALVSHTHTTSNITDYATATDGRINTLVPAATESASGKVELATVTEATTGVDTVRAVTPAGLKAVADTKAASGHTHTSTGITDFNTAVDARVPAAVPVASETVQGKVELATVVEVQTGTDTTRAVTVAGLRAITGNPETDLVAVFNTALV